MKAHIRFWELDALKGLAIIFVVAYHTVFDLTCFTSIRICYDTWFWWIIAQTAALLFILSSGISLALSIHKAHQLGASYKRMYLRATKLLCLALVITLVTSMLFDEGTIIFGILHFLAIASIINIPLYNLGMYNLVIASMIFLASFFTEHIYTSSAYFVWLGITPPYFSSFDYFPLIPWLGVHLIGLYIGKRFYTQTQRVTPPLAQLRAISALCFLGKHTLLIYLIHQPVLFALGYFLF